MKISKILLIIPLSLSLMSFTNSNNKDNSYNKEIIISLKEGSNLFDKNKLIQILKSKDLKYKSISSINNNDYSKYYLLSFENESNFKNGLSVLNKIDDILFAEENIIINKKIENTKSKVNDIQLATTTNYKEHYEIVKAKEAKALKGQNNKINVAVIDSGINFSSRTFKNKLDKTHSKSFVDNKEYDEFYDWHGTAVSYIIGGETTTSTYSSGICDNINLISLMIPEDCTISTFVSVMDYIKNLDIEVSLINYSFSMGGDNSSILKESIENYSGLFVCSASNDGYDLDKWNVSVYPAKYSLDNMIIVGESTVNEEKSVKSNYGKNTVDIFAPSYGIYSIDEYDMYWDFYGTSFAAPLVTGACALMLSIDNTLTASQLKSRIMNYADEVDSLKNYCINGNRLNIYSFVHTDKHTNYYEWVNTKIHLNNCKLCDYSIQEGHVVAGGTIINNKRYGTCITCKGSAEVGFIIETCSLNNNQEYDYINGLYYPKTTQVVDGILDLSYEDSLSYEKN